VMDARQSSGGVQVAPEFPVLDTLRAVGALAVLTTHTTFQSGDYTEGGVWGTLLARLDVGVAIFFVLSGFLLCRPYFARAALRWPPQSTGRYYWKRLVRIYPVYVVTVVVALALVPENNGLGVVDWARTLLLADVYVAERFPHALTQMWSLAAELAFYAVLPLLAFAAVGRGRALSTSRAAALLSAMVAISVWWHLAGAALVEGRTSGIPANWLPGYLTWFAVGMAFALLHVRVQAGSESRTARLFVGLGAMPGSCWAVAAGLLLVAATPLAGPTLLFIGASSESLTKHLLYALIGGLIVLTGIFTSPEGHYVRIMSARPLRHLGHISFSIFCIHLPLLHLAWYLTGYELFHGHGLQIWALTLAMTLVASELLYRYVELPGMRLKNLGRRTGEPADNAPRTPQHATSTR
jgi:peptidoglycan/LPS O-acetylase OafA/YrhL